jgi:hypothetical protein
LSIGWLYAWRWCGVGWIFLLGLPYLGGWGASSMIQGAFDVERLGMFFVSFSVFFLCFSLRLLGSVVAAYGSHRTGLARPKWVVWIRQPKAGWPGYIPWVLLGMPMIFVCLWVSATGQRDNTSVYRELCLHSASAAKLPISHDGIQPYEVAWLGGIALLGLLAALVLFIFLLWLHRRGVQDSAEAQAEDIALYANPLIPKWLADIFERAIVAPPWPWLNWLPIMLGCGMTRLFGKPGYCNPKTGNLRSGIRLSILMAVALLCLYWVIHFLSMVIIVPVLVYLTMLILLIVWWFNAFAFALDRFRIPIALPVLLLILGSKYLPWTQYRFESIKGGDVWEPPDGELPEDEAASFLSNIRYDGFPVIVAAEGGGIHSGAWAAHVLRLLEAEIRAKKQSSSFAKHIACVSGVSGGSYGLMYWVDSYGRDGGPASDNYSEQKTSQMTEERAIRSSLAASIQGLVYHDIWQTFAPIMPWRGLADRGTLMEREWVKLPDGITQKDNKDPLTSKTMMSRWREDATAGRRPAVLFNSMNADNGQPVVFASTSLGSKADLANWEYRRQRQGDDVSIVTAARCSASFPYVCPAVSPSTDDKGTMHLVDGGYFDNYGMVSMNRWLALAADTYERELRELKDKKIPIRHQPPDSLLVIEIRASSTSLFPQRLQADWNEKGRTGTLYQMQAPLLGLVNMRGASQVYHSDRETDAVVKRLEALHINVRRAVFRFPSLETPLSWHLTNTQKEAIRNVTFAPSQTPLTTTLPISLPTSQQSSRLISPPDQDLRKTAPTSYDETKAWEAFTRGKAQQSLSDSFDQVATHFDSINRAKATQLRTSPQGSGEVPADSTN